MNSEIKNRLASLGFGSLETSEYEIERAVTISRDELKAALNRLEIPDELKYTHIDMATGLILRDKKSQIIGDEQYGYSENIKSISEGEVTIQFASSSEGAKSPEARLDELISSLLSPPSSLIVRYRRLAW